MSILGIIFIIILPWLTGQVLNLITWQKKTSQIETYLIGFFSLFLVQGVVFNLVNFVNVPFETACNIFSYCTYGIAGLGIVGAVLTLIRYIKSDKKKMSFRKEDGLMFGLMVLSFAIVIARIVFLFNYERDDIMLETVRINLLTNTVNTYNPLTGRLYELGMIASKKGVTLSMYYTYWCKTYGIDARVLLYIVVTLQTLMCVLAACRCAMFSVLKTKKKVYTCLFFICTMLASGDYFKGAIGYKILWNGYLGDTFVAGVIVGYIIYIIMDFYRLSRGDYGEENRIGQYAVRVIRVLLAIGSSVFITSIPTGLLLIVLCLGSMIISASFRFGREEKA